MNTTTFCQSYIELAYQVLAISQKPAGIEYEYKRLKQESKQYVDYLEKFEVYFELYPALKKELLANLSEFKTGAFIEYQLDLFYVELKKAEEIKAAIQQEIAGLRAEFADESKEWLQEEENRIANCFRHLDSRCIQQAIEFLSRQLGELTAKKEFYLSEIQNKQYAAKAGERQAEEERIRKEREDAIRKGQKLTEQEIQERRIKAQEEYNKQMKRRKK